VPEAKRPDPKRRSPASRPGKSGKAGDSARGPRGAGRREQRGTESRSTPEPEDRSTADSVRKSIAESAEQQSEQRLGSAARRAAILAAVVCVLTLTIAGPVRTYFGQRTEMKQLAATEARLRVEIAELEQQKVKLADPVYIAAQARERLGFVMPGEIPYQVQLPAGTAVPGGPGDEAIAARAGEPWYTSLWHTIADEPHNVPPPAPPAAPPAPPVPPPGPPGVPPPGG
jgi:cell division protein FtsB